MIVFLSHQRIPTNSARLVCKNKNEVIQTLEFSLSMVWLFAIYNDFIVNKIQSTNGIFFVPLFLFSNGFHWHEKNVCIYSCILHRSDPVKREFLLVQTTRGKHTQT